MASQPYLPAAPRFFFDGTTFLAAIGGAVLQWVRPNEVLVVVDGEAGLWTNAAALKTVSIERNGKARKATAPVFWTVGDDEIPMSQDRLGTRV